jgi:YD repeat-containing protein
MFRIALRKLFSSASRFSCRGRRSVRRPRFATLIPSLEILEDRTLLSTVNWIAGSGNWNVAGNWLDATTMTSHVPTASDDAVIDVGGITVTHASGNDAVRSLALTDTTSTLALVSGSLATTTGVTVNGTLSLGDAAGTTFGNLLFNSTQTVGGTGDILFGGNTSNGLFVNAANATLTVGLTVHGKSGQLSTLFTGDSYLIAGTVNADTAAGIINQVAGATDAQVTAPGLDVTFTRALLPGVTAHYQTGPFGWGWYNNWQTSLSVQPDGTVIVVGPAGSERRFQPDSRGSGRYFAQPGDQGTLAPVSGGGFTLTELDGSVTGFRADDKLNYIQDTNGNRITAGYTSGKLTSLTHSSGQSLVIAYNPAGRISQVTDPVSHRVTVYRYDPTNQYLMSVQDADGLITQYTYDQSTDPVKMHALLSVTYPDGSHEYYGYDNFGRLHDYQLDAGLWTVP